MPPRKSRTSSKNPIASPLKSPKTLKKEKAAKRSSLLRESVDPSQTPVKASNSDALETPSKVKTPKTKSTVKIPKSTSSKAKASKLKTPIKAASSPLAETPAKSSSKTPKTKSKTPIKNANPSSTSEFAPWVSKKLLENSIEQLESYSKRKSSEKKEPEGKKALLFDDDEDHINKNIDLVIQFKKYLGSEPSLKPKLIKVEHSLYPISSSESNFKICIIVRDEMITSEEQLEKIEEAKIPFLSKIIPLKQLAKEYKTFDQKRALWKSYDLFLSDEGAITNLPAVLGKQFYKSAKVPIPIRLSPRSQKEKSVSVQTLKNQISSVLNSVQYFVPVASNIILKLGNLESSSTDEIVSNIMSVLNYFKSSKHNNGVDNEVRSIFVKLRNSPALPVYYDEKITLSIGKAEKEEKFVETTKEYSVGSESIIPNGVKLSKFEQSLLELGQFDSTPSFVEKKLKKAEKVQLRSKRATEKEPEISSKKKKTQ